MKSKTIATIKKMLESEEVDEQLLAQLKQDERKGVQKLVQSYENKRKKHELLVKQYIEISKWERALFKKGLKHIVGIDEAGRGPLAGPVVAAAVILPEDVSLLGLTDSKQLSEQQRNCYFEEIQQVAIDYQIAIIDNEVIDQLNILAATKKAMRTALSNLSVPVDHVLIDAVDIEPIPYSSDVLIKGDQKSISIAAASILAKVTRDQYMLSIHEEYPQYGFHQHKGYGTKEHINMIKKYGITPYHRQSFAPVKKAMNKQFGGDAT